MEIKSAIETLLRHAREAHAAPDAAPEEFTFRQRANGQGVDVFRNWAGVTLPFGGKKDHA